MAVLNFNIEGLQDYVATNRDLLVKNFALVGGETRRRISVQTGIKSSALINYLGLVPVLQNGNVCGFTPEDAINLTQRSIDTATIKVQGEICPETLRGTYAEYLISTNADEDACPFEAYIVDTLLAEVVKKIEKLIWQGDKTSLSTDLKWINGFLKIADTESEVIDETISTDSAYAGLLQVYYAMPEEVLERGAAIFVSPAIFRAFMQEIVAKNFYHYAGGEGYPTEFLLPGTDCKVIRTAGLAGSLKVIGTFEKNLFYGTDLESDSEVIKLWYSDDNETYRYTVKWNSGVQIAFPNEVVLGTFSAAPVVGPSVADSVAALADANHVYKTKEQA